MGGPFGANWGGKMVQRTTESEKDGLPGARRGPKGCPEPPRTPQSPPEVDFGVIVERFEMYFVVIWEGFLYIFR